MSYEKEIDDLIEGSGKETTSALALIAAGLFDVARSIRLLGNADAATSLGAIENLAMEVKEAGESMAAAIEDVARATRESGL